MKKTVITIIAVVLILVATMATLTACGESSGGYSNTPNYGNDNSNNYGNGSSNNNGGGASTVKPKTYLTLLNYDQYLDISAECEGTGDRNNILSGSTWLYEKVRSRVDVSSTSTLVKFYECKVEVEVKVLCKYKYVDPQIKIITNVISCNLDSNGNGFGSIIDLCTDNGVYGFGFSLLSTEVISVSGYVETL
ncbi:MAG: hypothetical protein HDT36_04290 [Clostridiales bacterium]|nr:hypothetical protein [Clostridiales bacterium]